MSLMREPLADCEIYDPVADAWQPAPPLNIPRSGHALTVTADGVVVVTGGLYLGSPLTAAEVFDGAAWRLIAD
jgi:hypothetical protein